MTAGWGENLFGPPAKASTQAAKIAGALREAAGHTFPPDAAGALSDEARNWSGIAETLREMGQ